MLIVPLKGSSTECTPLSCRIFIACLLNSILSWAFLLIAGIFQFNSFKFINTTPCRFALKKGLSRKDIACVLSGPPASYRLSE
jgi:hypothetical protein